MKTENLAIILTDIVGYTEATARLSRKEQKEMLNLHNQLLFPIIRSFGGKVVKTIGDALLLVFRSPTDSMLCSMAMQDALYDFNRKSNRGEELHIRIAASLGEVRVARNDVFGEPVNLTSRIESITPEDEIYLSDAIYLAMNKAEVPCVEVGLKQLKGITEPVRIWQIPRFSRSKLVPEVMDNEDIGELSYPYGGAHLSVQNKAVTGVDLRPSRKIMGLGFLVAALVAGGVLAMSLPPGTWSSLFTSSDPQTGEAPKMEQTSESPSQPAKSVVPTTKTETVKASLPAEKKKVLAATSEPIQVKQQDVVPPKPVLAPVKEEVSTPPPSQYAGLILQLESGVGVEMRSAAREIAKRKIFETEVLEQLEKGLNQHYQRKDADSVTVDALSWYCKVLGQAGDPAYLPVLEEVSKSAANKKLKKYAAKSLAVLETKISQ